MFTPPPSPMPSRPEEEDLSSTCPSPLSVATPETESEYPFPRVDSQSPKSQCIPEAGPSRIPLDVKKRIGRRTIFLVALLPAALILTASLHHLLPAPFLDDPPLTLTKREPQLLSSISLTGIPTSTSDPSTTTTSSAPGQSNAPTPTSPGLPTVPTSPTLPTPFPQPFDLSLTSNFSTQGCETFFANFTQAENFRRCRAFSFLLNASSAFLQAQHNLTLFNAILFGTCNTVPTAASCADTLSSYLTHLNDVCKVDIANQNPVVLQAQIGFQSFTAMREAACLEDPTTNAYCYMNAIAATPPGDIYFYALPLGTPLPNKTKPSCSPCVKSVLSVYSQYVNSTPSGSGAVGIGTVTGNSTGSTVQASPLPVLSKTYPAAARLAVDQCGGTYASISVAQPNAVPRQRIAWSAILPAVVLGSLVPFILFY